VVSCLPFLPLLAAFLLFDRAGREGAREGGRGALPDDFVEEKGREGGREGGRDVHSKRKAILTQ